MRKYLLLPVLTLAFLTLLARGDESKKKTEMDPKVLGFVKQVAELHKNAKSMHAEVSIASDIVGGEGNRQVKSEATYDMEKPNHFALKTRVDGSAAAGPDIVCDGKKLFVHAKKLKQYTEDDPIEDLTGVGRTLQGLGPVNVGMLFANVLTDDPYETLMDGVTTCSYAGTEKVNGTEAHHLKFEQPGMKWELWVAAAGKPVVLKARSVQEGDNGKLTTVETYQNWKIDAAAPKEAFSFAPNAESKKVKSIGSDE
jgi:hypothetical protein